MAINFVPQGEKILRKILKALSQGSTAPGVGDGGLKRGFGTLRRSARQIFPGGGGGAGGGAPKK